MIEQAKCVNIEAANKCGEIAEEVMKLNNNIINLTDSVFEAEKTFSVVCRQEDNTKAREGRTPTPSSTELSSMLSDLNNSLYNNIERLRNLINRSEL